MRTRAAVLAVAVLGLAAAGCDRILGDPPTGPTQTTTVIVNTGPGSPSPAPSASPSPGTATGPIHEVRVVGVGEACPAGIIPANLQRTVRVGCSMFITCTPKVRLPSGEIVDAAPSVHGPSPSSFGMSTPGVFSFTPWDANPFNADIRAQAPGSTLISCTVGGVTGSNGFTAIP